MMIFVNPYAGVNQEIPNIGLAYAATHFQARVIDLNTRPRPAGRFLRQEAEVLGISVQSRTISQARRIQALYLKKYPDSRVKSIRGFLDIQCCYPYLSLEETIDFQEPFSDRYPFPDYELFDSFPVFSRRWREGSWSYAIMTSQGCPFQCTYCMSRNRRWLTRSPENCFQELQRARDRWEIKSFTVVDDCFNVNRERLVEFCRLIGRLKLSWSCGNGLRADRFDETAARALVDSGCRQISFGIESIDPDVLKTVRKGERFEEIEAAVLVAKKYFDAVNGFFIIGLPGSSYRKDLASLEWARRMGINAHFSYYVPAAAQTLQKDMVFYGKGARPVSDAYSRKEQADLYRLTASMRPGRLANGWLARLGRRP